MPKERKAHQKYTTSIRTHKWMIDVCQVLSISPAQLFKEGFNKRFDMILNQGKIRSDTLEEILAITVSEIKVLERRAEVLRKALQGTLTQELKEAVKKDSKEAAIARIIGRPGRWKTALPERDHDASRYENWENAQEEIEKAAGVKVEISEIQEYVRKVLASQEDQ